MLESKGFKVNLRLIGGIFEDFQSLKEFDTIDKLFEGLKVRHNSLDAEAKRFRVLNNLKLIGGIFKDFQSLKELDTIDKLFEGLKVLHNSLVSIYYCSVAFLTISAGSRLLVIRYFIGDLKLSENSKLWRMSEAMFFLTMSEAIVSGLKKFDSNKVSLKQLT
ncbi:hypothetical protein LWI29_032253 [Acer saccharum]|uniref:Uncharacterized protein n=1 Tax=Acer saccharum TaxID=4024 RepID=A0AA39VH21_ACESA|nr:hypothetical protein LWI29_032253 [Acer saccharum]